MKRKNGLGPGDKSLDRGSTFENHGDGLARTEGLARTGGLARGGIVRRGHPLAVSEEGPPPHLAVAVRSPARSGFTPASAAQRAKVNGRGSIVSGQGPCDPAHLWPRSHGGCDHEDCVVPLTRQEHRAFDDGRLDLLPHLIAHGCWRELAHMVEEHHVDPIAMLQRLTGERFEPVRRDGGYW